MKNKDEQREIIRRYILGELTEAAGTELAERYFIDAELFDEVLDVESELLDQFVGGELSADERKKFNDYLTLLPDRVSRLAGAFALKSSSIAARDASPAPAQVRMPVLVSQRTLREWLAGFVSPAGFAYAAAVIILLIGLGYLEFTSSRLRNDINHLRAERAQTQQEQAEQQQAAQRERAAQSDRIRNLEEELAAAQTKEKSEDKGFVAIVASVFLSPSLRSGGTPDLLKLTPQTITASLIIRLPPEEQISSYRAVLQTTEGKLVFTQERLRPSPSGKGRTVTLRLPAARLLGDSFKLTLQGKEADGIEVARDYYFNLVRK